MRQAVHIPILGVLLTSTCGGEVGVRPAPLIDETWSKPVGTLSARLLVAKNKIRESENFRLRLELKNVGVRPVAVQTFNPHLLTLKIVDSAGRRIEPSSSRIDVISSPQWGVIPRDANLSFPLSIRGPDRSEGSHIDIMTSIWRLRAGKYRVSAEYSAQRLIESPKFVGNPGAARVWKGSVNVPAIDLEVVPESLPRP